jgi:hypothetical protein
MDHLGDGGQNSTDDYKSFVNLPTVTGLYTDISCDQPISNCPR